MPAGVGVRGAAVCTSRRWPLLALGGGWPYGLCRTPRAAVFARSLALRTPTVAGGGPASRRRSHGAKKSMSTGPRTVRFTMWCCPANVRCLSRQGARMRALAWHCVSRRGSCRRRSRGWARSDLPIRARSRVPPVVLFDDRDVIRKRVGDRLEFCPCGGASHDGHDYTGCAYPAEELGDGVSSPVGRERCVHTRDKIVGKRGVASVDDEWRLIDRELSHPGAVLAAASASAPPEDIPKTPAGAPVTPSSASRSSISRSTA